MKKVSDLLAPRLEKGQTKEEYVASWVSEGKSLSALARELGVPRSTISSIANADPMALRAARLEGAFALCDEARRVLEDCEPTREEISRARALSELLMNIAGKQNRAELGDQPASLTLNLDVGAAHLAAMRELQSRRVVARLPSGPIVDAELVDE